MNTVTVAKPALREICPKCGERMTEAIQEHAMLLRCTCGYSCIEVSGESKLNWSNAVGTVRI